MSQDAFEFVGWELIGVISQAIADDFESDALQECKKLLKVIAEVGKQSRYKMSTNHTIINGSFGYRE